MFMIVTERRQWDKNEDDFHVSDEDLPGLRRVILPSESWQTQQALPNKPAPTSRQSCAKLFCVARLNLPILDSVSRHYPVGSAGVLISSLLHECSQRPLPVRVL